jgi:hypothetical protein
VKVKRIYAYLCGVKSSVFSVLLLLLTVGCSNHLRSGDLIFVAEPGAEAGSMDEAIASATGTFTHVAIVEVKGDSAWVIDATPRRGVDRHPLDTFRADFPGARFAVARIKGVRVDAALQRAKALCGRGYDLRFLPDNGEMYCSELVQACYLDAAGKPLFESVPMNWLAPDGTLPAYWENLFRDLGMEVPQGVPGTNPQQLSESPLLTFIRLDL